MMFIAVTGILCLIAGSVLAQQAPRDLNQKPGQPVQTKDTARKKMHPVVLGHSDLWGGKILKSTFDSLLRQGLKTGSDARVSGFIFNYMERNIYEDSVGNIIPVTDFFTEYCPGDTLAPAISSSIYLRTKRGDTAYFDNIKVIQANGREVPGRGMKFVIQ